MLKHLSPYVSDLCLIPSLIQSQGFQPLLICTHVTPTDRDDAEMAGVGDHLVSYLPSPANALPQASAGDQNPYNPGYPERAMK